MTGPRGGLLGWGGGGVAVQYLGEEKGLTWKCGESGFASTTQNSIVLSEPQFSHWVPGRIQGKSSPSKCLKYLGSAAWPSPRGLPSP